MRRLRLTRVDASYVLVPDQSGKEIQAVRVRVYGPSFPERALAPELLIGGVPADVVVIARDGRSIQGYFRDEPAAGADVIVRYGSSQMGMIPGAFDRLRIRTLPKEC